MMGSLLFARSRSDARITYWSTDGITFPTYISYLKDIPRPATGGRAL